MRSAAKQLAWCPNVYTMYPNRRPAKDAIWLPATTCFLHIARWEEASQFDWPENLFESGSADSFLPPVPKAARQLIDIDFWTDLGRKSQTSQRHKVEVIGGLSGVQNLVAAKGANPSGCGFTCGKSMEGGKSSLASCSQEGGPETARGAPQVAPHRNSEKVDWIDLGLGCSCVTEWHRIFGLHVTLPIRPKVKKSQPSKHWQRCWQSSAFASWACHSVSQGCHRVVEWYSMHGGIMKLWTAQIRASDASETLDSFMHPTSVADSTWQLCFSCSQLLSAVGSWVAPSIAPSLRACPFCTQCMCLVRLWLTPSSVWEFCRRLPDNKKQQDLKNVLCLASVYIQVSTAILPRNKRSISSCIFCADSCSFCFHQPGRFCVAGHPWSWCLCAWLCCVSGIADIIWEDSHILRACEKSIATGETLAW